MITLESKVLGQTVKLPEAFDEIKTCDVVDLTNHIHLGGNKVLVILCERTSLFELAVAIKSPKHAKVGVTTMIAKINPSESEKSGFNVGDLVVTTDNAIEQGVHCHIPSKASYTNVFRMIGGDEELRKTIMDRQNELYNKYIYIFEFKIINAFDICATYDREYSLKDPFKG